LRRDIVEKIAGSKAVKKMKKELAYLVLYGSYAKGRQGPLSDVDLLVEFKDRKLDLKRLGALASMLEEELGVKVDLVQACTAPPALRYEALNNGIPVVIADRHTYIDDKVLATMEWLDFKQTYERTTRKMIEAIKRGNSRPS